MAEAAAEDAAEVETIGMMADVLEDSVNSTSIKVEVGAGVEVEVEVEVEIEVEVGAGAGAGVEVEVKVDDVELAKGQYTTVEVSTTVTTAGAV